eukprot:scaffold173887_cov22-Prasinocladus_malaysianus.AAC.2
MSRGLTGCCRGNVFGPALAIAFGSILSSDCHATPEVTRRGLGAVLPQKPAKLARLVKGIASGSPIPLTVKIRIGKDDKSINVEQVGAR